MFLGFYKTKNLGLNFNKKNFFPIQYVLGLAMGTNFFGYTSRCDFFKIKNTKLTALRFKYFGLGIFEQGSVGVGKKKILVFFDNEKYIFDNFYERSEYL